MSRVYELVMTFTDDDEEGELTDFDYRLNAPPGSAVTGGQIFLENPNTRELQRFGFRIDRDSEGVASVTVMEGLGE